MSKPSESECEVLIVGAGLAGLSTAWYLRKTGKKVRFIESSDMVGGYTKTNRDKGFLFDHTGHLLHLRDPKIKKWIINDMFKGKISKIDRISKIWSNSVYTRYPFQANTYGLPNSVAKECVEEYLKVLKNPPKKTVKTAEDFIYKHFGKGFAKHFMIPYNKKIWGVHPREMSAAWGERFIPIPKKEEVIAGIKSGPDLKLGYNSSFFYPSHGMGELSERVFKLLKPYFNIDFNTSLNSLDLKNKTATLSTGEKIKFEHLVSTAPLPTLLEMVKKPQAHLSKLANKLRYKPLHYLDVALNIKVPIKYHWCYIPSPKVPFYRVGIYSNFSSGMVPKGKSSMYVELSVRKWDKNISHEVIKELINMGIIKNKKDILFIKHRLIPCAYVIYDSNYSKVVPKIHRTLNKYQVYSIGRWGAWNYSSMEDALIMGRDVAKKIKNKQ